MGTSPSVLWSTVGAPVSPPAVPWNLILAQALLNCRACSNEAPRIGDVLDAHGKFELIFVAPAPYGKVRSDNEVQSFVHGVESEKGSFQRIMNILVPILYAISTLVSCIGEQRSATSSAASSKRYFSCHRPNSLEMARRLRSHPPCHRKSRAKPVVAALLRGSFTLSGKRGLRLWVSAVCVRVGHDTPQTDRRGGKPGVAGNDGNPQQADADG